MAEYLTGDAGAVVGDTVRDVLAENNTQFAPYGLRLWDFVVDSVVNITNDGITITRHYVHEVTFYNNPGAQFVPQFCFWQAGMGPAQGIHLKMDTNFGHSITVCAMTGDSTVLSQYTGFLPSAFPCCISAIAGIEESLAQNLLLTENPSSGLFKFTGTDVPTVTVFDARGRALFATRSKEVDLSEYPPGYYRAMVVTADGVSSVALVVMR